jgi:hypothetical protein
VDQPRLRSGSQSIPVARAIGAPGLASIDRIGHTVTRKADQHRVGSQPAYAKHCADDLVPKISSRPGGFTVDQLAIDVEVEEDAPEEEVRRVEVAFREAGLDASVHGPDLDVDADASTTSLWIVAVTVPLIPFFKSFMEKAGELAGEDAYRAVRKLFHRILDARSEPSRDAQLTLEDPDTSVSVTITLELPDAAFKELLNLDPEEYEDEDEAVVLEWDDELGEWTAVW